MSYWKDGNTTVYLPVGETSKVPMGVELEVYVNPLDYEPDDNTYYTSFIHSLKVNGDDMLENSGSEFFYWLPAEEDLEFEAVFKGYEESYDDSADDVDAVLPRTLRFRNEESVFSSYTGTLEPGELPAKQLTLVNGKNDYGFSGVEMIEINRVRFYPIGDSSEDVSEELFSIDEETGVFSANEPLEAGRYVVTVDYMYTGASASRRQSLTVHVGPCVGVDYPLVRYKDAASDSYMSTDSVGIVRVSVNDLNTETFSDIYSRYLEGETKIEIANYENSTGLGVYNSQTNSYSSLMQKKVSTEITKEYKPYYYADIMLTGFKPALVEPLTAADIIPVEVEPGWNQIHGVWYYYETSDPFSMVTNSWLDCYENDGKQVWVGADGVIVTNGVVKADGKQYLVDEKGHKRTNAVVTIDGMDYITDADGVITETKLSIATPSNADEITDHVDKVTENLDTMSEEDQKKAADMLTEALKNTADLSKVSAEDVEKYEALYKAVYGEDNIAVEGADGVTGAIAAAGLTSADFEDGPVTIQYVTEWLGTASNAAERISVKLYVNGVERTKLTAPITLTIGEMPETFVASYSNALYNFNIADASDVDVDTENGVLKLTITRLGVFEIKAALKNTSKPSSGGSSGSGKSSGGSRAKVNAEVKTSGTWMQNQTGWWFRYDDGTWPAAQWAYLPWNGGYKWYYFNEAGYMVTGWYYWQKNYYYLYPIADGNQGHMFTGWHEIGGKWYYFSEGSDAFSGAMAYDTTTPDGYRVGKDGAWIQ